jgi:beta-1,4-mannosyl-glycoprotein beta-1,4-N-acetylglucosaminyltransferase
MIFDCFTFNDELDLLELRLEYLNLVVDKFVLIESEFSFSGNVKPLYFQLNKARFERFADKIIYASIPFEFCNKNDAWQNEYFQRNFIKTQLTSLQNEDIVHLSDVDEIPNLTTILKDYSIDKPYLIELPVYYYFLNLKSDASFKANLLTPYQFIKEFDLGKRERYFELTNNFIEIKNIKTGWHFSYLFGHDITKYQNKLKSFSHTEYNTPYYLNEQRIKRCIKLGVDFFERAPIQYWVTGKTDLTNDMVIAINKTSLQKYFFNVKLIPVSSIQDIRYLVKLKLLPRLKTFLRPSLSPILKYLRR